MSGICGIYNYEPQVKVGPGLLEKMADSIRHRGPKFKEIFLNTNIGLAVNYSRQDIQSRYDTNKNTWCIIDGKIFNKNGSNKSDSELIISAYEKWGEDFIKNIEGEFALCIWDTNNQKLILARNHSGNKPLYYCEQKNGIIFGSEIKSILSDSAIKREIDPIALDAYFSFHDVPTPDTLFKGIKQVPAGSILIAQNGRISIKPYWKYNSQDIDHRLKEKECSEILYNLLLKSVKKRLEGEENVGAFLSSGLDSSTVTFLIKQALNKKFKVFSVGFHDEALNELPYARKTADFFGVDMHDIVVDAKMAQESLSKIIQHTDLPFYDASAIPTYYGGLVASQNSDLVLTGDGSDQLLGGSTVYAEWKKQLYLLPEFIRGMVLGPLLRPVYSLKTNNVFWEKVLRNAKIECMPAYQRYSMRKDVLRYSQKEEAYSSDFRKQLNGDISLAKSSKWFQESNRSNFIEQLLYRDVLFFLQDDLLIKVDRMLSANAMEFRTPFLDIEVMNFISKIPLKYKIKGIFNPIKKYILKKTFKKHLPEYVLTNRKTGFEPPYIKWMRNEFKGMILEHLLAQNSGTSAYFNPAFVKKTTEQFYSGAYPQNWRLVWAWFMFELWYKAYIRRQSSF